MGNTPKDDVLDHILQACPTSSLTVLSLVSSHIRVLALPHLLRTVSLDRNPQQVLTFLNFILNNTQSRNIKDADVGHRTEILGAGRYIIKLEIVDFAFCTTIWVEDAPVLAEKEEYPISTWAPILTRALALMPNLHSIVIEGKVEEIAFHSPDFALALFSLPRLTYIDLWSVGLLASNQFGHAMDLRKDVTNLQTVKFSVHDDLEQLELTAGEGMGSVLFHTRGPLTEINVSACNLRNLLHDEESEEGRNEIKTPVIFPNVVILTLECCDVSLTALASAFPALRTLIFSGSPFSHPDAPPQTHKVSFPSLVSIKGQYKDLHVFLDSTATHSHLRRVVVDTIWTPEDDDATPPFAVTRAVPFLKSLHFTHSRITHRKLKPLSWWKALGRTLPHLTYLAIPLDVNAADELDLWCIQVPRSLASVPLAYVSLSLRGTESVVGDGTSPEIQSLLTAQAIALSYARNIPTLKHIDICKIIDEVKGLISWWSVVRESSVSGDDMCVQVKAIDAYEGRALRSWYDLEA
ncbi:hypothetical protein BDZ97DRAFT_1917689 [Flammula alnicola]|nr:hypothetical protein BDZ97DRAFT_1917689 [Flammula alnicola]